MNPSGLDLAWVGVSAALVFVMQGGFALLESGLTRSKNSINVAIKNLTDLGVSLLGFWAVGFGLMFGPSLWGLFGGGYWFFGLEETWPTTFFLFQAMFCSTAATIVSGAVAERMRFSSYLIVSALVAMVVYPISGAWAWGGFLDGEISGWLGRLGFVDFAGSTVVHSVGGWVSLAALAVLGPRLGRFNPDGSLNRISGSNLPNAVTGVILLWFGWFGFNGGSTLALTEAVPGILLRTTLAAAAGLVAALLVGWPILKVPDVSLVINGSLGGLVAITAPVHAVSTGEAIFIGAVGGLVVLAFQALLDKTRTDDAVGAIPVHLGAGVWGTLAVGLFGDPELLNTGLEPWAQTLVQALGAGAIGVFAFGTSFVGLKILNWIKPLRVSPEDELKGLNAAEHEASTEIYDLYRVLDAQTRTGDLTLRAPVEPFTEVGQIAQQYNRVMDSLQENLVAKSEYVNILDNVSDGLFLMDPQGALGPYHSRALAHILGSEQLSGQTLDELLAPLVKPQVLEQWRDFLEVLFDAELDYTSVARLNPLAKVELFFDTGEGRLETKHVSFLFQRVLDEGALVRAFVLVRDLTEQTRLEASLEQQRQAQEGEMALFYKLLHIEPGLLAEFTSTLQDRLVQMNLLLESNQEPRLVLEQLGRLAHGLKGESSLLELDFLTASIHSFESGIQDLKRKATPEAQDFLSLTLKLGDLQSTAARMRSLMERLGGFQKQFAAQNLERAPEHLSLVSGPPPLLNALESLVKKTAAALGKQVRLEASALNLAWFRPDEASILKDLFIQWARNAVVHGLETPQERRRLGKAETGQITLWTEKAAAGRLVGFRDDGGGLNLGALRQKAVEGGQSPENLKAWTEKDWIRFAFSGVSTASGLSEAAGRGWGLGLVKEQIRRLNGRLSVRNLPGQGLEFRVLLGAEGSSL